LGPLADQGDTSAKYNLGVMYAKGRRLTGKQLVGAIAISGMSGY
jgi:TPR repeat protein